jgi:hypothetical protein
MGELRSDLMQAHATEMDAHTCLIDVFWSGCAALQDIPVGLAMLWSCGLGNSDGARCLK